MGCIQSKSGESKPTPKREVKETTNTTNETRRKTQNNKNKGTNDQAKRQPKETSATKETKERKPVKDRESVSKQDGECVIELTIPNEDHKYIVGKGGENIKKIIAETGADIQLDPDKNKSDKVVISAKDQSSANKAKKMIKNSIKAVKEQHENTEEWYQKYQAKVDEHARKRNEYNEAAKKAYESGDGKLAKELSEKAKKEGELMKQAQKEAARAVFKRRNKDNGDDVIDLHGLQVAPAVEIVSEYLDKWQRKPGKYIIITGKGLHSDEKGPKIRPAVEKLLKERKIKYNDVPGQYEVIF